LHTATIQYTSIWPNNLLRLVQGPPSVSAAGDPDSTTLPDAGSKKFKSNFQAKKEIY